MNEQTTRMVFATAALAAVAAVLAGPAGAQIPAGDGVQPVASQSQTRTLGGAQAQQGLDMGIRTAIAARSASASQASQSGNQTIPYLSQGVGVDKSQFAGNTSRKLGGVHGALALNSHESGSTAALPHGIQVVLSPPSESQSLGLTGDSPLSRVSAPEPEGLTGDTALTRVPDNAPTPTVSSGNEDIDWTSFGAGAGMVALIAAGLVGVLLTARRRHTVGMP